MSTNIGPKIGIDGEAEYRKQIQNIIQETKTLKSEYEKVSSSMDKGTNAFKKNKEQSENLTKQIEVQSQKVEELRKMTEQAADKFGESDTKTLKWKEALNKAETELNNLKQDLQNLPSQLDILGQKFETVGSKIKSIGSTVSGIGTTLSTRVTLPLVAVGTTAVNSFAEVDKTMTLVNATMANGTDEAELLNTAMKTAAANSVYGMSDAATAMLSFARAGLTAEQAAAAIAPAMNLAAGEGGDLDTVAAGLVGTINAFGDSFAKTEYYADIFATACNSTQLDINSLSDSMASAATVFRSAGYDVEDAALYMGIMADNSIPASEAANSLGTGLARLVAPAKQGREMMKKLGISIVNADGSMKDTITIQKELHDTFTGLSESEQIAAASAIFGKNQMDNWLALINTAPEDVAALSKELENSTNATNDMANAMMSGFGGSLEKLKSSADVARESFGEALAPTISKVADSIQNLVDWFNSLDQSQRESIAKAAMIVAAVGPILTVGGKLITGVGSIISVVGKLMPVIGGLATFITGTAIPAIGSLIAAAAPILAAAAPFIAVGAAIVGAGILVYKNWDTIKEKAGELKDWVSEKWNGIKESVTGAWDKVKTATSTAWDAVKKKVEENGGGIEGVIKTYAQVYGKIWQDRFNEIDEITGGKLSEALNKVTTKLGEIKKNFTETFDKIKEKVKKAIDYIKGLFDFEWSFPKLKLPHFSIVGEFSLKPPSVPDISVDWYRKAMNNGIRMTSPTIFGMNGNKLMAGGEAGAEWVIGENSLLRMIQSAVGTSSNASSVNIGDTTIVINANAGQDVEEIAEAVDEIITARYQAMEAAWT